MLFSSVTFLFAFLPAVLLVYYISPRKIKNFVLMLFSMVFYAWGEPKYIFIMMISITIGYLMGLLIQKYIDNENKKGAKRAMILAVSGILGFLVFFKYMDFLLTNISELINVDITLSFFKDENYSMPIGISFYTFQILSYCVDVYWQKVKAQKNIITLATYISLFPQLIAGPIVRYETVAKELETRKETIDLFGDGVTRFILGLGKKVLIANVAGEIFDNLSVLSNAENTVILSWLCAIAFTIQIYFDFSGYSDMAIGLGKMFGFGFLENFNYPYISKSITEFWRRWHISLSTWFRDYIYIPLGGNRKGKLKTIRNMFIIWLLTGFWHGAEWNFLLWGLYYFVILMVERLWLGKTLEKIPAIIGHIYSLLIIIFGWVIFAYDDMSKLGNAIKNLFGFGLPMYNELTAYYLMSFGVFLLIAIIAATPLPSKIANVIVKKGVASDIIVTVFLMTALTLSISFLVSDSFNPFLYFRF